jgi:hypothetical protein
VAEERVEDGQNATLVEFRNATQRHVACLFAKIFLRTCVRTNTVLHRFGYSLEFLSEQMADGAAADMVAQPTGIVNHPSSTSDSCQTGARRWACRGMKRVFE